MRVQRGSIYLRTLIALLVTMSILPLAVTIFRNASCIVPDYALLNDELAMMDLRRILLLAYDMEISDTHLKFIYHGEDYVLGLVNERLILHPGTQMYLDDVKEVRFYTKNGSLYMSYVRNNGKEYERNIAKEEGIHLDDFPLDNDELPDPDDLST